jgi:hypothetical protein
MHRHPRISPAVYQVSINGPYSAKGAGDTPSRQRILIAQPASSDEEEACAQKILTPLMRRAYRRPVTDADLAKPLEFFRMPALKRIRGRNRSGAQRDSCQPAFPLSSRARSG